MTASTAPPTTSTDGKPAAGVSGFDDPQEAQPSEGFHAEAAPDEVAPTDDPRVLAMLPAQLLQPGELIILLLKPSPWFIILESLGTLVVLLILLVIGMYLTAQTGEFMGVERREITLLIAALAGARLFWEFLEWLSRVYVLTDRRVIRVQGVLRITVFEASLKQVQHTTATFSLRERLVGLGTIGFATAGTAFTEAYWRMVARPLDIHRVVVQTLERYR